MRICLIFEFVFGIVIGFYVTFSDVGDQVARLQGYPSKEILLPVLSIFLLLGFFFHFLVVESLYQKFKKEKQRSENV